jgi:hypothetical protein
MKATLTLTAALCLIATSAFAQPSHSGHHHHHHHNHSTGRGYGYSGGGVAYYAPSFHRSTEFGDGVSAMALLVQAQGQAALLQAQAYQAQMLAEQQRIKNAVELQQARLASENLRAERKAAKLENDKKARDLAIANRVPYTPPTVVSAKAGIQWIAPLKSETFAGQRQLLDKQVAQLARAKSTAERDTLIDGINESCQNLIVALGEHKDDLSANAYDSSCRFVNRLYDNLSQPVATNALTSR